MPAFGVQPPSVPGQRVTQTGGRQSRKHPWNYSRPFPRQYRIMQIYVRQWIFHPSLNQKVFTELPHLLHSLVAPLPLLSCAQPHRSGFEHKLLFPAASLDFCSDLCVPASRIHVTMGQVKNRSSQIKRKATC